MQASSKPPRMQRGLVSAVSRCCVQAHACGSNAVLSRPTSRLEWGGHTHYLASHTFIDFAMYYNSCFFF